jgi:uncharacterized membrane-anchored protein
MKKITRAPTSSVCRRLPKLTLMGWAEPPHYDSSSKKLYWAKELGF